MTILGAVLIGASVALLIGWMMPVAQGRGFRRRIVVGVIAAVLGSVAATAWTNGSILKPDVPSALVALIGALYAVFANQCLALRG